MKRILMTPLEVGMQGAKLVWSKQADAFNQWDTLSEDEQIGLAKDFLDPFKYGALPKEHKLTFADCLRQTEKDTLKA